MLPDFEKPRRIVGLHAENFKRLKAVHIAPDGTLCVVSGRNAQGKSSVLDAVWSALAGASASPPRPIRNGSRRAVVELDLGDLVVTRTWTSDTDSTLTVRDTDSVKLSSPQKILDRLVGKLGFDPLAFLHLSARAQAETLRQLVGLDLSDLDGRRTELNEERKELNRAVKQSEAQFVGLPVPDPDTPAEPVDTAALLVELRAARADKTDNDALREAGRKLTQTRDATLDRIADLDREIARLVAARDTAQVKLKSIDTELVDLATQIGDLTDPPIAEIEQRLADAQAVNQRVWDRREREALAEQIAVNKTEARALADRIDLIEADRAGRLAAAAAKLPVPGLSFDGDGVTLDGVPLEQASSAQQIRAGLAIAAALNPSLRVALVRDGSLLDSDGLRAVQEWAAANDVQVFLERVADAGSGMGVVIEDGSVVADRQAETEAALLF